MKKRGKGRLSSKRMYRNKKFPCKTCIFQLHQFTMQVSIQKNFLLLILLHVNWMASKVLARPTTKFQDENHSRAEISFLNHYNNRFGLSLPAPSHLILLSHSNETSGGVDGFPTQAGLPRFFNNSGSASDLHLQVFEVVRQCNVLNTVYVNCSARDFYNIPTTKFPVNITIYDLSCNHITTLFNHSFSVYALLEELYLQGNKISKIDPLAFFGLSNLESLYLYTNKLVMNSTTIQKAFSEQVFVPLKNLKKLRLEGNNPEPKNRELRYPHKALSHLENLEELSLDGLFNASFENGFANLTRLTNLSLSGLYHGRCMLTVLTNETFRHLTSVEQLSLKYCNLQGHLIEAGTFLPLKRLKVLYLNDNQDINVQFFNRVFYGLQNTTSLTALHMQKVVNYYTIGVCLSSKYIKYFPQSVVYLDIRQNRLECIDRNVIDIIRKSLKVIDIGKNGFVFGTYFMDLHKLDQLEILYDDGKVTRASKLPRQYPYNPNTPPLDTDNCSLYERKETDLKDEEFTFQLPPKLKYVKIQYGGILYVISKLNIGENNSLETLIMEGNYIPILNGPINGLQNLRDFQLSSNFIYDIAENFFHSFNNSLQKLNLSSNNLGDFFRVKHSTRVFQNLINLESLDLASNTIRSIGHTIFQGMINLKYLRISHNPIYIFGTDLSHSNKLQAFIASDTRISSLPKNTRDVISQRIKMGTHFDAQLDQSPVVCDCPNLPFVKWMVTSGAFNFTSKNYCCYFPDTSSIAIHDGYTEMLNELSQQCSSKKFLFFAVIAATFSFVIFIICSLAYRYRWKLRYMYHAAYNYVTSGRNARSTNRFDYDVFICYAEEDRHFVMDMLYPALESRGLSVFVHHRHFTAGELIGSNIVRAVNSCRRTLVVLTRTLAESSWCNYEIQMANMESAQRGEPVLIFLLLGGIRSNEMGNELLYNLQTNTYIPFPSEPGTNERALNALYDKLARDIRG
ncbi:hypothetical protein RRG08_035026 [Elysia crispata]|uniref:TIR domain-containing protein n=1 Tax=Elysia crispata TaxID=231223 RepID=A0AAE0ZTF1_9GAST|nr:hypothetical protein RRG08_035026 [Elysia crispata]